MHGVPKRLKLAAFRGRELQSVDLLENIVYFRFGAPGSAVTKIEIGIEGEWQLFDPLGAVAATGDPFPSQEVTPETYPIREVVTGSSVEAPVSFTLTFASGMRLRVLDSKADFESFSIPQLNVWI